MKQTFSRGLVAILEHLKFWNIIFETFLTFLTILMHRILGTGLVVGSIAHYLGKEGRLLEMVCSETHAHFNMRLRLELHCMEKIESAEWRELTSGGLLHTFQWVRIAPMRWQYKYFPSWEVTEEREMEEEYYRGRMLSGWCDY